MIREVIIPNDMINIKVVVKRFDIDSQIPWSHTSIVFVIYMLCVVPIV